MQSRKKREIRLITCFQIVLVFSLLLAGCSSDERQKGLDEGYQKGSSEGWNRGYQQGVKDNEAKGRQVTDQSFKDGERKGYQAGYSKGLEEGYSKGYNAAFGYSDQAHESMSTVRSVLIWIFANIFYPIMVIALFLYIILRIINIVVGANATEGKIRRTVGAALPLLVLVFLIIARQERNNPIEQLFRDLAWYYRFLAGGVVALALMVAGEIMLKM